MTDDKLLTQILTGLDNLAKIESHLARVVELLEQQNQPATPRSYLNLGAADVGVDEWLAGKRS
jgi:hypothetical protein